MKTQIKISAFCTFHSEWRAVRLAVITVVLFNALKRKQKWKFYQHRTKNKFWLVIKHRNVIFLPLPAPAILILNKGQNELSQKALRVFDLCPLQDPRKSVRNFRSYRQFSTGNFSTKEVKSDLILSYMLDFACVIFKYFASVFSFWRRFINGKGRGATCLTSGCSVLLTAVLT